MSLTTGLNTIRDGDAEIGVHPNRWHRINTIRFDVIRVFRIAISHIKRISRHPDDPVAYRELRADVGRIPD